MKATNETGAVCIIGTGAYLPERILTNLELEKMVDTSDEWIRTRTGIRERHIAAADEATSDLAAKAAERALQDAGIGGDEIDLIIVATITPDMPFPSTACLVQNKIQARNAFCFDIEAACSGFVYALDVGHRFLKSGGAKTALIIGGEKLSSITDWSDRSTCVLFGDGAGAVVLRKQDTGRGIMGMVAGSDGSLAELLHVPGGGSRLPASPETLANGQHFMKMAGNEVFKHAVRCMSDAAQRVLEQCGLTMADIDWIVPHQANERIIQAIATRLGADMSKVCLNLEHVGNMSGASVPVALDEFVRNGRIQTGHVILFIAFGGGFTWGASVMEWNHAR
ncbi:MAG: ketoacyl-ACP synthase III [Verrucomicrobia bacterium]|nr:ketoacyl-ACP synthase III [Verrucomicrobiota bacterium]